MTADTSSRMLVNMPICRRARSTSDSARMRSCSACVSAARCFHRRAASATASRLASGATRATTALTVSLLVPWRSSRDLDASRRRGELELKLLGIQQRDERDGVAAGRDLIFGQVQRPRRWSGQASRGRPAPIRRAGRRRSRNGPGRSCARQQSERDLPVGLARSR